MEASSNSAAKSLDSKAKEFRPRYNNERSQAATTPSYVTNKNNSQQPPLCRFFVIGGNCRYGTNCAYSHEIPRGEGADVGRKLIPCPYFIKGNCRYGEHCRLRHDEGDVVEARKEEKSSGQICGICLEDVTESGKKFGLLGECEHCFCIECLCEWRKTKSADVEVVRTCPTCRVKSNYIVPSRHFYEGEEKKKFIAGYKEHLSGIPCRKFNGTIGSCPFGRDCFYAHRGPDGEDLKPVDKRMRPRRRRNRNSDYDDVEDLHMISSLLFLLEYGGGLGFLGRDSDDDDDSWDSNDDSVFGWGL